MDADALARLEQHQLHLEGHPQGVRGIVPGIDFSGMDFTAYSFKGIDMRHCDFTDCKMPVDCTGGNFSVCKGSNVDWSGSDITGAIFEKADVSGFNFVGARCYDVVMKANPIFWQNDYTVWQTDVWAQINCKQFALEQWFSFTDDFRRELDVGLDQDSNAWWYANKDQLQLVAAQYAALL